MKVLQVNRVYNIGSTGKIVADIHKVLVDEGIDSVVCYGTGKHLNTPNIYHFGGSPHEAGLYYRWSKIMGLQFATGDISTYRLIKIIKKEKPDIVHLHCINSYLVHIYRLMRFLKKNKITTIITHHAEFMYTGSCGHAFDCEKWKTGCGGCPQLWAAAFSLYFDRTATAWKKMFKAFEGFDKILSVCVSPWQAERAKQAPILHGKDVITIENGLDTTDTFRPSSFQELKKSLEIGDKKIILHVTASFSTKEDDLKGGRFLYNLADKFVSENIVIIIVDGCGNAVEETRTNIINVGKVQDQKVLAQYYSMADITVITSKRETFNMPVAESLACGTPVVGFLAGGPETISLKDYSEFVEYGNVEALTSSVRKWLTYKAQAGADIAKIAGEHYSKEKMCKNYLEVYKTMID